MPQEVGEWGGLGSKGKAFLQAPVRGAVTGIAGMASLPVLAGEAIREGTYNWLHSDTPGSRELERLAEAQSQPGNAPGPKMMENFPGGQVPAPMPVSAPSSAARSMSEGIVKGFDAATFGGFKYDQDTLASMSDAELKTMGALNVLGEIGAFYAPAGMGVQGIKKIAQKAMEKMGKKPKFQPPKAADKPSIEPPAVSAKDKASKWWKDERVVLGSGAAGLGIGAAVSEPGDTPRETIENAQLGAGLGALGGAFGIAGASVAIRGIDKGINWLGRKASDKVTKLTDEAVKGVKIDAATQSQINRMRENLKKVSELINDKKALDINPVVAGVSMTQIRRLVGDLTHGNDATLLHFIQKHEDAVDQMEELASSYKEALGHTDRRLAQDTMHDLKSETGRSSQRGNRLYRVVSDMLRKNYESTQESIRNRLASMRSQADQEVPALAGAPSDLGPDERKLLKTIAGKEEDLDVIRPRALNKLVDNLTLLLGSSQSGSLSGGTLMMMAHRLGQIQRKNAKDEVLNTDAIEQAKQAAMKMLKERTSANPAIYDSFVALEKESLHNQQVFRGDLFGDMFDARPTRTTREAAEDFGKRFFSSGFKISPARYGTSVEAMGHDMTNAAVLRHILNEAGAGSQDLEFAEYLRIMDVNASFFHEFRGSKSVAALEDMVVDSLENKVLKNLIRGGHEEFADKVSKMNYESLQNIVSRANKHTKHGTEFLGRRLDRSLMDMDPDERIKAIDRLGSRIAILNSKSGNKEAGKEHMERLVAMTIVQKSFAGAHGLAPVAQSLGLAGRIDTAMNKILSKLGMRPVTFASSLRIMMFRIKSGGTTVGGTYFPNFIRARAHTDVYNKLMDASIDNKHILEKMFKAAQMQIEGKERKADKLMLSAIIAAFNDSEAIDQEQ